MGTEFRMTQALEMVTMTVTQVSARHAVGLSASKWPQRHILYRASLTTIIKTETYVSK